MTDKPKFTAPQAFEEGPAPTITLDSVESNQVRQIGYDDATQTLAVTFNYGKAVYHYPNVTRETFEAFKGAESIGRFFGEHIKALPFKKYAIEAVAA
jgi:hypothetical protein